MQQARPRIAVDAMGGDFGPGVLIEGAIQAARQHDLSLILVGDEARVKAELDRIGAGGLDISIQHASQVVEMEDKPSEVLRRKKDSSIQVACRMVKEGLADGVVSAGNSGATLAAGMFTLGRIQGVERPALASLMPTVKGSMVLIDVGANVDCKPHHLVQFGIMADVLARDVLGLEHPKVGLLSIGEEEGKGNLLVKEAYDLFRRSSLNFLGNVEGRDVFTGDVDVVVCDGFVGNVALKLSEGLAASMARVLKRELKSSLIARLGTLLSMGALRRFARVVDYAEYGGAPLLGLKGIVIVCHGASNGKAISSAVRMAYKFITNQANDHLVEGLSANSELTMFARRTIPIVNHSTIGLTAEKENM